MSVSLQVVISGIGGRGVLMLSRILSELCRLKGVPVRGSDELGMSQRGGSVSSFVKMGNFSSPLVGTGCADCLIAMELDEGLRSVPFLKEGGYLFINAPGRSSLPDTLLGFLDKLSIKAYAAPCDSISKEVGNPRVSNLAMLGLIWKVGFFPFEEDELFDVLRSVVPERFYEVNVEAFKRGLERGSPLT